MNILHITSILPSPLKCIGPENDILLRIADEYEKRYPSDKHFFIFIVPYANRVFASFKNKWKDYYTLLQHKHYFIGDREIEIIGLPGFRYDLRLRKYLTSLGYHMNKGRIDHIIKTIKPDLCHAHNMMNNMELAEIFKVRHNCQFVLTARNVNEYSLKRIKNKEVNPCQIISINFITKKRCDRILGDMVQMIPHPVDDGFFVQDNLLKDDGLKKDRSFISLVSVCQLITLKNLDKVIHAISTIKEDIRYTIIGDGPERNNLMDLAASLGLKEKVRFEGRYSHDRLQNELKKYDLFIMPSFPETLGRVYFEALASGIPVVASKGCGVDGMIKHGEQGYLVEPLRSSEIASAILDYIEMSHDSKIQMKQKAMMLAQQFTWGTTLERYHQIYHSERLHPDQHLPEF